MTVRTILNNFNSKTEQNLYDDLVNEFVQTWGIDSLYIPRTSISPNGYDNLFGDDPVKSFTGPSYTIECYIMTVDNYEGQNEMFTKFGLAVSNGAKFLMPNRAWKREVQGAYLRPREGDLLYFKNFGAIFEIKYVDENSLFYPFGKGVSSPNAPETNFYGFTLNCEKFRYNNEIIQTSVPEVSSIVNSLIATYQFNLANTNNTGSYLLGESAYQTDNNAPTGNTTCSGTVNQWNLPTGVLQLDTIQGLFLPNNQIFGANSGASWTLNNYNMLADLNNPMMDNPGIETAANTILNFSESNPFGAP